MNIIVYSEKCGHLKSFNIASETACDNFYYIVRFRGPYDGMSRRGTGRGRVIKDRPTEPRAGY